LCFSQSLSDGALAYPTRTRENYQLTSLRCCCAIWKFAQQIGALGATETLHATSLRYCQTIQGGDCSNSSNASERFEEFNHAHLGNRFIAGR
jgi:hypothetical protein